VCDSALDITTALKEEELTKETEDSAVSNLENELPTKETSKMVKKRKETKD
jgi:hypothetical protein